MSSLLPVIFTGSSQSIIANDASNVSNNSTKGRSSSNSASDLEMQINTLKAIAENRSRYGKDDDSIFITDKEVNSFQSTSSTSGIHLTHSIKQKNGGQHVPIFKKTDQGYFFGLFAGIRDNNGTSDYLKGVPEQFFKVLNKDDLYTTFKKLFAEIDNKYKEMKISGFTAVLSFIPNEKVARIYTATLGNSRVDIYREVGGNMKSLPLSRFCDWSSTDEKTRLASLGNMPSDLKPKKEGDVTSYSRKGAFTELSRAFGYKNLLMVTSEPFISVAEFDPLQDTIVMRTAGFRKFVNEQTIVDKIAVRKLSSSEDVANYLMEEMADGLIPFSPNKIEEPVTLMVLKRELNKPVDLSTSFSSALPPSSQLPSDESDEKVESHVKVPTNPDVNGKRYSGKINIWEDQTPSDSKKNEVNGFTDVFGRLIPNNKLQRRSNPGQQIPSFAAPILPVNGNFNHSNGGTSSSAQDKLIDPINPIISTVDPSLISPPTVPSQDSSKIESPKNPSSSPNVIAVVSPSNSQEGILQISPLNQPKPSDSVPLIPNPPAISEGQKPAAPKGSAPPNVVNNKNQNKSKKKKVPKKKNLLIMFGNWLKGVAKEALQKTWEIFKNVGHWIISKFDIQSLDESVDLSQTNTSMSE